MTNTSSGMDGRLTQILPMPQFYKYSVESVSETSNSASFNATFTVNVDNEQEFSEWMKNFQRTSDTQFNIHKTYVCDGRYVVFKKTYKCHHNVNRGVLGRHKHTSCNAKATVTIRHCPKRIRKDRTKVHPDGLCLIDLRWEHNHPLSAADVVHHYSVSPETNEKLRQLFRNGHSPSSALECIRMELEDEVRETETLEQLLANRSICPDYRHCHYLFTKEFKEQYGDPHDNDKLQKFCDRVDVPVPLEVPSPVEVSDPAEELTQHIATVDRLFQTKVHNVARENPDAFISAYKTFIDSLQSLSTANAAASALQTFGKYAGGGKRVGKRLSSITVPSTAIARRKKLLRGKHPGEAGRPRKSAVVVENKHDYSLPSRKRNQPEPHALGECVPRNISLGSSHSKK